MVKYSLPLVVGLLLLLLLLLSMLNISVQEKFPFIVQLVVFDSGMNPSLQTLQYCWSKPVREGKNQFNKVYPLNFTIFLVKTCT